MNYKIKKISEINQNTLDQFFKMAFPSRYPALSKHWKWYYKFSYTKFEPLFLEYNSSVIGMAGLIPEKLSLNGKFEQAIWFTDFYILEKYRNKGFGSILTDEWMKICPVQITYCNEKSLKIFKKHGWKYHNKMVRKVNPINIIKFIPILKKMDFISNSSLLRRILQKDVKNNKSIDLKKVEQKNIVEYCKLEEKKVNNDNIFAIARDENWFKWRLIDCPYASDIYEFKCNGDIVLAHIIKANNFVRLNILCTFINDKENNDLFSLIYNWCLNNNIDYIWTICDGRNGLLKNTILNNFLLKKKLNFACWAENLNTLTHLEKGLSNSQGFDTDLESYLYQGE